MKQALTLGFAVAMLHWAVASPALAHATAFTYQGRLTDGGTPASGIYDLRFTIYDALENGIAIVGTNAVPVTNGRFSVTLGIVPATSKDDALRLEITVHPHRDLALQPALKDETPVRVDSNGNVGIGRTRPMRERLVPEDRRPQRRRGSSLVNARPHPQKREERPARSALSMRPPSDEIGIGNGQPATANGHVGLGHIAPDRNEPQPSCGMDVENPPWWYSRRMPPPVAGIPESIRSRKGIPSGNAGIGTTTPAGTPR